MEHMESDFCVVGGGPAGLALSLLLLRSGARVALVERARSFDREFRGEILQPGGMLILQQLGVLDRARRRGGYPLRRFQLVEHERVLMDIDYGQLPAPYDFLLSIPQQHLLAELLAACREHQDFTYLEGQSVTDLHHENGRVAGAVVGRGEQRLRIDAHVTVGADGRYSKTRKLAGLGYTRVEAFEHDILWFKIASDDRSAHDIRVYRSGGSPVLIYDSYPDSIQIGWTLPHGGYKELASEGFPALVRRIEQAVPIYADRIRAGLTGPGDLSLLDVFAGSADSWVSDGLVLIGDAAHTHGPIGAQGINLALQDAAVLHPVLVDSWQTKDAGRERLSAYERTRRPDIDAVFTLQARQSAAMLSHGGMSDRIRPLVARLLAHTPVYRKVLQQIAFGRTPVRARADLFIRRTGSQAA
ncbi:FAD-dependent monooxygenase [Streptomyces canus]|uniref:FAD-dependent monooxygenase n=1 Tax=Streptomyces canus TaxID=58343 RepID=UPI00225C3CC8|nr:FAD-dependent monooxygenase [Streptomyces canus]MCX5261958.1 FAD-dependent monooxygenase [Streptomyces canus]